MCCREICYREILASMNAPHLMKEVYEGKRFKDGVAVQREASIDAALYAVLAHCTGDASAAQYRSTVFLLWLSICR